MLDNVVFVSDTHTHAPAHPFGLAAHAGHHVRRAEFPLLHGRSSLAVYGVHCINGIRVVIF